MSKATQRIRRAMRAYERFWRDPEDNAKWLVFVARHTWVRDRFCADRVWCLYRRHLRRVGIDPSVVYERGTVTFRRV